MGEDYEPWGELHPTTNIDWTTPSPGERMVFFYVEGMPAPHEMDALAPTPDLTVAGIYLIEFHEVAAVTRVQVHVPMSSSVADAYGQAWELLKKVLPSVLELDLAEEGIKIGILE